MQCALWIQPILAQPDKTQLVVKLLGSERAGVTTAVEPHSPEPSASAAPLSDLEDRDEWIGWNVSQRMEHLPRVLKMNRFLIRPRVHCQNLASRVLGLCARPVAEDFQRRYGLGPWLLESFGIAPDEATRASTTGSASSTYETPPRQTVDDQCAASLFRAKRRARQYGWR